MNSFIFFVTVCIRFIHGLPSESQSFSQSETFSSSWIQNYKNDVGCTNGVGKYSWQKCGFGYNINTVVNSWLYSLVVGNWNEFSIIIGENMFQNLECYSESDGLAFKGWSCIFDEIPHLCILESEEEWKIKQLFSNISTKDIIKVDSLGPRGIFARHVMIENALSQLDTDIDHMGAVAVLTEHIWNHMTPWTRRNVDSVFNNESFEESPYIGLHVRRGDKLWSEAKLTPVEVYLQSAVEYFENNSTMNVDDIKGIWLASDDPTVILEVIELASIYFPNIPEDSIIFSSDNKYKEATTTSVLQGYRSFVYMLSDIEKLSKAELFVGTFSSNLGRHVAVHRDINGKSRNSSISVEHQRWVAG